jgi:hypothetical protein
MVIIFLRLCSVSRVGKKAWSTKRFISHIRQGNGDAFDNACNCEIFRSYILGEFWRVGYRVEGTSGSWVKGGVLTVKRGDRFVNNMDGVPCNKSIRGFGVWMPFHVTTEEMMFGN